MRDGSPEFYELLEECANLHENKSYDYASNDNPFGNYHFAGYLANMFSHNYKDAGFVGRIGEKIFRLANLESARKIPKNESIEDTERDIVVIVALWMASRRHDRHTQESFGSSRRSVAVRQDSERLLPEASRTIRESDIRDFARIKAKECAGIFIADRSDAIEPFTERLVQIIKEWEERRG